MHSKPRERLTIGVATWLMRGSAQFGRREKTEFFRLFREVPMNSDPTSKLRVARLR
jgi:hypothetical protein